MTNQKALVSIIMSCYNSEESVEQSIESILNQTYENIEFLIMDDGSTDSTFEILNEFAKINENIRIFKNENNIGLTKSLNLLINYSNGEFIARQDADDISLKTRIEKQMMKIRKKNLDFCVTRATIQNTTKKIPGLSYFLPSKFLVKYKNPFIHGTMLLRKKSLHKIGCYDENYYFSQDYKLISDMIKKDFKYKKIWTSLYLLNMKNNISSNQKNDQQYYANCVKKDIRPDPNFKLS